MMFFEIDQDEGFLQDPNRNETMKGIRDVLEEMGKKFDPEKLGLEEKMYG